MSVAKKILIGCGAITGLGVVAVVGVLIFVTAKKRQYDRIALPYLEEVMPVLSSWSSEEFEPYWAPEVAAKNDPQKLRRLFKMFRQLGELESYDEPAFRNVTASTSVPYPAVVLYVVVAQYEAGQATLSLKLVPTEDSLKVWSLHINSDAFLPAADLPATDGGQEGDGIEGG